MKIWAVANQKGGVGKTTTAVSLGGLLAEQGKSVLLIDLDPHGSMSAYFGLNPDDIHNSVYTLFKGMTSDNPPDPNEVVRETPFENLCLIPASTALATLDRQLGTHHGMGLVISKVLKSLEGRFDYAIIDCPPVLGVLMVNALAACQRILVPVQTEYLAEKGLERMLHTLTMIKRAGQNEMPHLIIPTLFDRRTKIAKESLEILRELYPQDVWQGEIPMDTKITEASKKGQPPSAVSPKSRGVMAYRELLAYLQNETA